MGIIQRQSFKYTLINLVGLVAGVVSTLFVYPLIISEFGFIRYLQEITIMLLPILTFGMGFTSIKYYTDWKDEATGNHGLLGLTLFVSLIATLVTLGIMAIGYGYISQKLGTKITAQIEYFWFIFPIAALTTLSTALYQYLQNSHRVALPSLLMEVLPKLSMPIILICYWKQYLNFNQVFYAILIQLAFTCTGLAVFLYKLGDWSWRIDWAFLRQNNRIKSMFSHAVYYLILGLGLILATRTDLIWLGSTTSMSKAGAYSIVAFMVATIEIPTRALYLASNAKVPVYWASQNLVELEKLYQKVSVNLVTVGMAILGLILVNFSDLVSMIPNPIIMKGGFVLIVLLGIAKLADCIGSLSHVIIYFSKKYRWGLISLALIAIINATLSYALISKYGSLGAAITTLASVIAFNLFGVLFLYKVWGMKILTKELLLIISLGMLVALIVLQLPHLSFAPISMTFRSMVFISMYLFGIFTYPFSHDFKAMLRWKRTNA
jgi:O-antigen/teichoic acid export membrane protein